MRSVGWPVGSSGLYQGGNQVSFAKFLQVMREDVAARVCTYKQAKCFSRFASDPAERSGMTMLGVPLQQELSVAVPVFNLACRAGLCILISAYRA